MKKTRCNALDQLTVLDKSALDYHFWKALALKEFLSKENIQCRYFNNTNISYDTQKKVISTIQGSQIHCVLINICNVENTKLLYKLQNTINDSLMDKSAFCKVDDCLYQCLENLMKHYIDHGINKEEETVWRNIHYFYNRYFIREYPIKRKMTLKVTIPLLKMTAPEFDVTESKSSKKKNDVIVSKTSKMKIKNSRNKKTNDPTYYPYKRCKK